MCVYLCVCSIGIPRVNLWYIQLCQLCQKNNFQKNMKRTKKIQNKNNMNPKYQTWDVAVISKLHQTNITSWEKIGSVSYVSFGIHVPAELIDQLAKRLRVYICSWCRFSTAMVWEKFQKEFLPNGDKWINESIMNPMVSNPFKQQQIRRDEHFKRIKPGRYTPTSVHHVGENKQYQTETNPIKVKLLYFCFCNEFRSQLHLLNHAFACLARVSRR